MVQTLNFINLSSQQAPNDVNWAGLVNSGVQGVLIRLGHGIIRDPCASGHIAKAKQYGLYWHGYHTYEGVVNEPQFTIKNATELGLSTSQYYFVDLTKSSDPFNDYYALHANWLSKRYSTGLLISNEDYLSKFTDSEVTASGSLRWLISDTEPANYDIWQYSSEGTIGTSSVKVGFNFAKTDKLKYNLSTTLTGADINKDPYNPQTPVGGAYIGWGYDTTGLGGGKTIGYSTNGKNFYALIGPNGLVVRKSDGNRIYGTIADQIDSAISANVIPAKSVADSAVAYANDAIENSRVNSQAIDDINSAVSDAVSDAAVARSDGLRAWNAAQSNVNLIDLNYASASASISSARTEAIAAANEAKASASAAQADIVAVRLDVSAVQAEVTDFGPALKSAQSDAGKALTQIADTASALSETKAALTSDVAVAKNLANAAQTTANNAVESAGENAKALTSQANALSDARKAMDSGIANAKELANTAQTTADSAIKSASSVANDLAAVASQAKSNANGITKVTSDVGLLQTTVADNSGNISTIQETTKQIQQAVSDNSGNITVAKQTADSAATVASDAKSNATVAVQTASEASVTAKNAQGDAATAMVTAQGAVTQASDAKSNATIAVQTASEASLTATNAQGDASIAKQTASETSTQIKTAQGDISKLQNRAGTIEASVANNSGAIADVQATANQLKASVSDNAGNITVTKQTADSAVTVASDAKSNATVAIQTASQASITAKNASGQAASAVLTANGAMTTASNAKSDATVAIQTASGASLTAINANSDATVAKQTASEAKVQASNAESDFAQLSIRAGKIEASVANNSGAIASVQQTANGLTTTVGNVDDRVKKIEDTTNWTTKTGALDMDTLTTTQNIYYRDTNLKNADGEAGWAYIQVVSTGERVTQTVWHDRSSIQHTRTGAVSGSSYNWDVWNKVATYSQVAEVKQTIDGITTTINDPKTGLNATYQTAAGNATTISNAQGDIAKLKTRADGFEAEFTTANGNISKLQTDANGTTQTLANTKSDVAVLQSRADGLDAKYATAAGDINTLKTNASGFSQTLTNAQGDISTLKSTVSGVQTTLTDAQGNISTLQSDVSGLKKTTSDHTGSIATLQATANTLTSQMSSAQGDISTLKQTASGISSQVSGMSGDLNNLKSQAQWVIVTDTVDLNNIKTPCHEFLKGGVTNAPNEVAWWYLTVEGSESERITQTVIADQSNNRYTRRFADSWSAWVKVANQNDIDTLNGKITANTTAINQNKNAIALKADQTTVDKINGTVSQMQSTLTVQAGQIQEKVTSSQVTGMLAGYATQDYTQSLVTTTSNNWNLNLTNLKTDVDAIKANGGGVNLLTGTSKDELSGKAYWFHDYQISGGLQPGTTYTLSGWARVDQTAMDNQQHIFVYAYTSNWSWGGVLNIDGSLTAKYNTATFTTPSGEQQFNPTVSVYLSHPNGDGSKDSISGTGYISKLMLEKGTVAHDWSPAPSDMATVTSVTNLSATVDGIQAQVYNSDGSSKITQLSNLIATKVSQGDYNSQITQFQNDINLRVKSADLISQINLQAGTALIQSNKLVLDAGTTVVTGNAFIPVAAIADLTADQVQAGTLKGVKVDFRDSTGTGMIADGSTLTFDVSNTPAGYLSYNGMPVAELPDGSGGNELAIRYRLSTAIIPDDSSGAQATFSKAAQKIAYMTGTSQGKQMLSGLEVHANNHHWLCAVNSDATCNRFEVNDRDGLNIAWHDNTHFWISDGKAKLYKDYDDGQTATKLEVHGWAWVNGWVEAAGHSQHSALSTKTALQSIDDDEMLEMVNNTDLASFLFKTDVASGETHRHIGLIIDDVHDVAQYQAPQDFIAPNGVSRDDDNMIGALFGAVKALTKRIKTLESKVG